jgi:homoserine O-acetyltransferase/O-succinyltransferase
MSALLTYRSRDSFESRFGRKAQIGKNGNTSLLTPPGSPKIGAVYEAFERHNNGHRNSKPHLVHKPSSSSIGTEVPTQSRSPPPQIFSAQSYLRYQGDKFISRFDANCYIHITRKLDTHDVSRDRLLSESEPEADALARVLGTLPPRALVISIATDGLFTPSEQKEIASHIPGAELVTIQSPDGHDGFLLEFEQINTHILRFLTRELPELYQSPIELENVEGFEIKKTSMFGEAEADITAW